jgi:hypothetical protein
MALAVSGLVVWGLYLALDVDALAWTAVALLVPVAGLGSTMFIRWIGSRRARHAARAAAGAPPESRLPVVVVVAHGLLGVSTVLLVLGSAVRS